MKFTKTVLMVGAFLLSVNIYAQGGNTANADGTATASVIASLSLTNSTDLIFGEGIQGDSAKSLSPSADLETAEFFISGEPNRSYTVTLPADGTVIMTTGAGGTNETIAVDSFIHNSPESIPGSGIDGWRVGATRAALGASQVPGSYSTTFTVSIVY